MISIVRAYLGHRQASSHQAESGSRSMFVDQIIASYLCLS